MLFAPPPPPPPPPVPIVAQRFAITHAAVAPRRAFIGGRPVSVQFAFRGAGPTDVRVRIERDGRLIRGWRLPGVRPATTVRLRWNARNRRGALAREGRYRVRAGPVGGRLSRLGGFVRRKRFDPVLNGNYVIVRSPGQRRDYWYSHLRAPAPVREGERVRTGQRLGEVGATGNAVTVGCHLHFELHGSGGPFDPVPRLRTWDRWS